MNEIERFLDQVCCGVAGSPDLRRHLRKELREHLTEEIESNVAAGLSREEAVRKAIAEFGDPAAIRDGLQAVHGRRLMSLLIEKSMAWRETTMKTGWKWSFVAQVALVLTIAAQVYFTAAALVYILPGIVGHHHHLGTPPLAYLGTIRRHTHWLFMDFGWIPLLLAALALWLLFEWRYRGENKSTIRLAGLSLASLATFVVLALVCIPMVIDLVILPGQIYDSQVNMRPRQAERLVVPNIATAEAALAELREAVAREDWSAAEPAAEQLDDAYSALEDASPGVIMLAGETRRDNLDEILALIDEIAESSDDIRDRLLAYRFSQSNAPDDLNAKIRSHLQDLEASRAKLAQQSALFAAHRASKTLE